MVLMENNEIQDEEFFITMIDAEGNITKIPVA
jgi:hypothetical protein